MPKRQQRLRKQKASVSGATDAPERASNAGPLQSHGLTEMEMIEKALNTKPPKRKTHGL